MKKTLLYAVCTIFILWLALFLYLRHRGLDLVTNHPDPQWNKGSVFHLLPAASHDRILIKASFTKALSKAPHLDVAGRSVVGRMNDTKGYFWQFDAPGLAPETEYTLALRDADGKSLCDPWPLSTLPAPESSPRRLRLLIYTGLGGHDINIEPFGIGPLPLTTRIKLLNKALSFKPDALISSGDHIYYDLLYDASSAVQGNAPRAVNYVGRFDRSLPALATPNEEVLKRAVSPQIANLYGTACRSVPTFFLLDDHDYFENDIATKEERLVNIKLLLLAWRSPFFRGGVSFPPDKFMLDLGRTAQKLYLPEMLPAPGWPKDLPAVGAIDRAPGVSECYGTLRYGKLFEGLLFESRRFTTLTGKDAVMIHPAAERWLIGRMKAEETDHVVNLAATIFGLTAGKWMEWYPDILNENGKLTTAVPKYLWQEGWFLQHNRILKAASSMKRAVPLFICGDIHCQAEGRIFKSGPLDLSANPVNYVASGSVGTGPRMWPSSFRGIQAMPPLDLTVEERMASVEKNGFVIVDVTPEKIVIKFYSWLPSEPVEKISTLEPHHVLELKGRNR